MGALAPGKTWRRLLCYVQSDGGMWEAICVDLDIAVQAGSFGEVVETLSEAVSTYVADAMNEDEQTARRLLARRAPWHIRAGYILRAIAHLFSRRDDNRIEASFDLPCPA